MEWSSWTQIGADIDGEGAGDESGKSVFANNGTIVIDVIMMVEEQMQVMFVFMSIMELGFN